MGPVGHLVLEWNFSGGVCDFKLYFVCSRCFMNDHEECCINLKAIVQGSVGVAF